MSTDDVEGGDMPDPKLSDDQLASLLDGAAPELADHRVAEFLAAVRQDLAEPAPNPAGALSEFLGVEASRRVGNDVRAPIAIAAVAREAPNAVGPEAVAVDGDAFVDAAGVRRVQRAGSDRPLAFGAPL